MFDNTLDRHDRVGALGDDATGGDAHRLAGGQWAGRGPPRRNARDHGERPGRVRRTQRKAVHGGARERGQVDPGGGGLRQDAPGGRAETDRLRGQRSHVREHARERIVDREQIHAAPTLPCRIAIPSRA